MTRRSKQLIIVVSKSLYIVSYALIHLFICNTTTILGKRHKVSLSFCWQECWVLILVFRIAWSHYLQQKMFISVVHQRQTHKDCLGESYSWAHMFQYTARTIQVIKVMQWHHVVYTGVVYSYILLYFLDATKTATM